MYRVMDASGLEWGETEEFSHPTEAINYMNDVFGGLFWQRWEQDDRSFWYAVFSSPDNMGSRIQFIVEPKPPLS